MSHRALELAAKAIGQVSPSPLVGCVIVSDSGEIVGEGTYYYDKTIHAEVIALDQAGAMADGATAYISLEPHSHHGRTPPCTDALIKAGIKRVVCPIEDPNPLVSGKGFETLRQNGIEVVTGVLKKEAEKLNEKFIHWHKNGRPFVHVKIAMSLDGKIATKKGESKWITGPGSRAVVQHLRHEYDAILVGGNTAFLDDPSLTDRSERMRHRKLVRIILDNSLRLPLRSQLVQSASKFPTIVFTNQGDSESKRRLEEYGVEIVETKEGGRDLRMVLKELGTRKIQSVLVEGGGEVAGSFHDAKLIDKVSFFVAPIIIGGKEAPASIGGTGVKDLSRAMRLRTKDVIHRGEDIEVTGYPVWNE
ncbi:MAG: bifunctional diaminohydroxyphosphoribosylaminopyrimidine deaminase/5-amino-6-(5-phosphoribosylamino)uracil reductase RibD [Pyrinomonadaceae bacterium]|nr:bifunctional diaminohydroxyphosphoribosylaminopyrimidine deaminase/5-amino-6-(5-phosphoribosylamino)uracil reductase RibD [Pyrinomonadaceae bacterium]